MSAPNSLIAPQTAAATADFDATELDKIVVMTNTNALGVGETVAILFPNTANGTTPVYDSTGAAATLKNGLNSVELEGGFLYRFTKGVTASNVGVDIIPKPRQGS